MVIDSEQSITPKLPDIIGNDKAIFKLSAQYLEFKEKQQNRSTPYLVHFDSRQRDAKLYPDANSFSIIFPRIFEKIKKLEITALEFTSTSISVNETNNMISWVNENEKDVGYPVYTAAISIGIYTIGQIMVEIVRIMNMKKRTDSGLFHKWIIVSADAPNNALRFYNIISSSSGVPADPINTVADSNILTITQANNKLNVGDLIYLDNVVDSPGGIPDDVLNSSYTVNSILDSDRFTIICRVTPYISGDGGGTNVTVGRASKFRFVQPQTYSTSRCNKTLLQLLGFPIISCKLLKETLSLPVIIDSFITKVDKTVKCIRFPKFMNIPVGSQFTFIGCESIGINPFDNIFKVIDVSDTILCQLLFSNFEDIIENAKKTLSEKLNYSASLRIGICGDFNNGIGFETSQTNIYDEGSTYNSIDISGDSYCYIVAPELSNCSSQYTNAMIKEQILCKVQLTTVPGYVDFNKMVRGNIEWKKDGPDLADLKIKVINPNGSPTFFQGLEYSGTLQIEENMPKPPYILQHLNL